MSPIDFWDYTIQEANDIIEARSLKQKHELQFRAMCGYNESMLILQGINNMFDKHPKQPTQLWDIYPTLFDKKELDEQMKIAEAKRKEEQSKARLLNYAIAWNKKIGKG